MADISGLVLTVLGLSFQLASTLYSYSKDVREARSAIQQLGNELFALIGVLEHLKHQQEQFLISDKLERSTAISNKDNLRGVLEECQKFLEELQQGLRSKDRVQATIQKLKWPLKDTETKGHLQRLERLKTYFILSLVTDDLDITREIASQITVLASQLHHDMGERRLEQSREKHRNITRWLMQPDPNTTRTKVAKSRTPGSGVWFTDGMAFNAWLESPSSSVLWLNGITGAGKTTLMTTALDHLLSSHKAWGCVAYFYSAFSDSATLEASNILCSIIGQLCKPTDRVYSRIEAAFDAKLQSNFVQPSRLSTDDVLSLLIEHIQDIGKAYIFLDAINECGDPLEIVDYLRQILVSCPESAVHVFVSSINEKGIEDHIKQLPCLNVVTLSPLDISLDIELLVLSSIEANPRLRKHNSEVKHEIAHTLTRGAQGMFRWVQCQLDRLSKLRTPGAIHGALETLPPTLDKTYEDMLCRIEPEDKELAHDILELLSFSLEPLNLNQVCEYLQVVPGMDILDESKKLTDPKDILSVCGSLLNYQSDTEIVTLAHHSVYTYLESNLQGKVSYYKLSEVEADRSLALKCLTYLSTQTFAYRPDAKDFSLRQHSKDHPFLSYAAQKWPLHTQKLTDLGEPLWATLKSFLFSKDLRRGNFLSWVQMLIPKSGNIQSTPPLYYAASYGLLPVVRYLLQAGAPTEVYGGWGSATPINIAAYRGYADVVKLLLDHGADPVALDGHGMGTSAIGWARAFRHTAVLEVFAAAGYKVPGLAPRPNGAPARGPQYSLSPVPGS